VRPRFPGWLLAPFVAGSLLALAGGYWDDAWHTERGRDDFFIAPHLAIYGGVMLIGGALGLWLVLAARRLGGPAAALRHRPLRLALLSVCVTLAAGPIDNGWHVAFGRDAVIWSPPHVLGIVGTATLAITVLVELARSGARWAAAAQPFAGAAVLAPFSFLVIEFDSDVPQFDPAFYLPVLAAGSALALAVVRLATGRRRAAAEAATVHLSFVLLVSAFLALEGFDVPLPPLLLVPALALDVALERRLPLAVAALAFAASLFAVYVPVVDLATDGVFISAADVLVGLPVAWLMVLGVVTLVLGEGIALRRPAAAAGAAVVALLALPAVPALAHDPGQGEDAGSIDLVATVDGRDARLDARVRGHGDCGGMTASALVARRAGRTLRAPLRRAGCRLRGRIALAERGRWFLYVELRERGRTVESWLPVTAGGDRRSFSERGRFAYLADRSEASLAKLLGGVLMYGAMLLLLVAVVRLVREAAPAGWCAARRRPAGA
jgi:hypothetical protein